MSDFGRFFFKVESWSWSLFHLNTVKLNRRKHVLNGSCTTHSEIAFRALERLLDSYYCTTKNAVSGLDVAQSNGCLHGRCTVQRLRILYHLTSRCYKFIQIFNISRNSVISNLSVTVLYPRGMDTHLCICNYCWKITTQYQGVDFVYNITRNSQ